MTETTINLNNLGLSQLESLFNRKIEMNNYLPNSGEGETMATQLATAMCKIDHRYRNDGDRYDRKSCKRELGTFANWIHNNCFKLKRFSDYEENLKYMLRMGIALIDDYSKYDSVGSVYTEEGTRTR